MLASRIVLASIDGVWKTIKPRDDCFYGHKLGEVNGVGLYLL